MNPGSARKLRSPRRTNAQGLVEFALILPMLLLVLFGIVDMGWIAFNFSQLYNGVREGVRYGSVTGFNATLQQYINCDGIRSTITSNAGFSGIKAANITITYDDGRPGSQVGSCPAGGSYSKTSPFTAEDGTVYATGRTVQNGDRILVTVNINLRFLTPLIRSFAPAGIPITFTTSRSVFPGGLLARAVTI